MTVAVPGAVRLVRADPADRRRALASWVERLQSEGHRVLVLSWDATYEQLRETLATQGLDPDGVFILDAVGSRAIGGPKFLANAFFVESPVLLEKAAARAETACRRLGPSCHVVLDSLNLLALYNPPTAIHEFLHHLATRLRSQGIGLDLMLLEDRHANDLAERLSPLVDHTVQHAVQLTPPASSPIPPLALSSTDGRSERRDPLAWLRDLALPSLTVA